MDRQRFNRLRLTVPSSMSSEEAEQSLLEELRHAAEHERVLTEELQDLALIRQELARELERVRFLRVQLERRYRPLLAPDQHKVVRRLLDFSRDS